EEGGGAEIKVARPVLVGQVHPVDSGRRSADDDLQRQRGHEGRRPVIRFFKWALLVVVVLVVCALGAFLYFIPPFFTTAPEDFGKQMAAAAPAVDGISDPAERAMAARGRYIVMTTGCNGCHATNGPQGPDLTKYMAGRGTQTP